MLSIINNVLVLLLVSLSFPVGYIIGTYSESEIEKLSEKIEIERFFNVFLVLIEIVILIVVFSLSNGFYTLVASIIIVLNLFLCAFYTSIKADFVRIVGYQVLFLVITLIVSSLILLV